MVRKVAGKGRVAYIAAIEFDGPLPPMEPHFTISNRFWKLPANARQIVAAVKWTAREEMPVEITGPPHLVANVTGLPGQRRRFVHLVDYNAGRTPLPPEAGGGIAPPRTTVSDAR